MECKFEIAARMGASSESSHIYSRVRELTLANCTHIGESSESLEIDRGRNSVL